jgi:hypothetical protein
MLVASFGRSGTTFSARALQVGGVDVNHDSWGSTACRKMLPRDGEPAGPPRTDGDCLARFGAVSWPHAFALDKWCQTHAPPWIWRRRGRRLEGAGGRATDNRRFAHIFHFVRDPLRTIISRFNGGSFQLHPKHQLHPRTLTSFIECLTTAQPTEASSAAAAVRRAAPLRFTLRAWVLWHSFIEASAEWRLRVEWRLRAEDMRGPLLAELVRRARIPMPDGTGMQPEEAFQRAIDWLGNSTNHEHTAHVEGITWRSLEEADALYYAMAVQMAARYGYASTLPARESALAPAMDGVAFQRCGFVARVRLSDAVTGPDSNLSH